MRALILLLAITPAVWLPGDAAAQGSDRIVREWALRGVIITDHGRSAVLEHLPSRRQDVLAVGTAVTPHLAIITVEPDRVVLDAHGGDPVILRLGHDRQEPGVRGPTPAQRGALPPVLRRPRGR